jgi:hypothetical protein
MEFRTPREHGTWGMFFIPFVVGWLAAGRTPAPLALLLAAATAVFLSRENLLFWWRARRRRQDPGDSGKALLVCAAVAAAGGAALAFGYRLYGVIPLGIAGVAALLLNAELALRRQGRTVATEFLGVASSSLNAAGANYVAAGVWTAQSFWVWLLCALYFGSSIFYVKLRVQDAHGKKAGDVDRARRQCTTYHVGLIAALVVLAATRNLPLMAAVSFTPVVFRALLEVLRPSQRLNLKRIGWLEVTYSLVFLVGVIVAFQR